MAIDQGTTGTTVLIIDKELKVIAKKNNEFPQIYPRPGWVEHNPEDIWASTTKTIGEVISQAGIDAKSIEAIGITNQRETTIIWERASGHPIHNAIVWQCRRTADICQNLKTDGFSNLFHKRTGLVIDPYFSGTKIKWLLENVKGAKKKAMDGKLQFGTVDTYLVYKLTGGQAHVTDVSNASRTLLMDLNTLDWDKELVETLHIDLSILPKIRSSSEVYGTTKGVPGLPDGIPISGIAGDQHAALFGQACFDVGDAKCTYGTGSFTLMNTGTKPVYSKNHLLTTVAWKLNGTVNYALEGSAFIAGAAIQWLRDGLKMIKSASEVESLAESVEDSGGLVFLPALTGLGAPHWEPRARGIISGIDRGTTAAHLARATLEGIAFQNHDILIAMEKDLGKKIHTLKVDGGAAVNDLLIQFQCDLAQTEISRPQIVETTALGAAFLAGLATGFWKSEDQIQQSWKEEKRFKPKLTKDQTQHHLDRWNKAIKQALDGL